MPECASATPTVLPAFPSLGTQAERLIESGCMRSPSCPQSMSAAAAAPAEDAALLAVHPEHAPASALAPLLRHDGRPGFVGAWTPTIAAVAKSASYRVSRKRTRPYSGANTPAVILLAIPS
ncbi:hypothetical protein ABZ357_11390 [Streptomyces sp. NPDC005917]|uniref:hypothetical protein n=1 Tax=unclassified Streptomyces TaxID=2593676 RepID=UPI0033BFEC8E